MFNVLIFIFYRSSDIQYPFNCILRILIAFSCFINNHKKSSQGIFEPGLCTSGYVTRVTRDLVLTSPGVFPLVFTKQTTHFLFCQVLYQYVMQVRKPSYFCFCLSIRILSFFPQGLITRNRHSTRNADNICLMTPSQLHQSDKPANRKCTPAQACL